MTEDVLSNKLEKFYFNMNIFDEDHVEEVIVEEPPPPIFSEGELAAAKKAAFAQGKQEGIDETKKSRSEFIAKALGKISQDSATLFQQESVREKRYEQEAVALSLKVFKALFPVYQKHFGFEELKDTMTNILQKQQGQKAITVYVEPDALEGTQKFLTELSSHGTNPAFEVLADEKLANGDCKMSWQDGGAVTNTTKIADEIRATIEQVLAASGAKVHDEDVEVLDVGKSAATDEQAPDVVTEATPKAQAKDKTEEANAEVQTENHNVNPDGNNTAETQNAEITEKPDE